MNTDRTREANKLIVGLDLNPDYVQATYWHSDLSREPQSLDGQKNTDLLDPQALLKSCLQPWIDKLQNQDVETELHVMVTVRDLTEEKNNQIVGTLLELGVDRKRIYVQDYLASFYYYAVNQKKELWAQDVALLTYEDESIVGYVLHIDRSHKPAVAKVEEAARQKMDENVRAGRSDEDWNRERDRLFFELLKKVFERRTVTVSYLIGDYFNKSWAVRSIQFLCTQRRAYQGMNLYSKGACFAAMERAGFRQGSGMIFSGKDVIDRNLWMEVRVRGKETLYPLVEAGMNWYEVHSVCEFIPCKERGIRLISGSMSSEETTEHSMRLPGLPDRPDRAGRFRMTVYFTSPSCCHIEVEDLGFGGLYPSSGLSWSRDILF